LASSLSWPGSSSLIQTQCGRPNSKVSISFMVLFSPPSHSAPSWLWKGILSSQPVISKGACHRIHQHSSIPIWNSPWVPIIQSFSPSPAFPSFLQSSDMVVSDLINQNATWNIPLISSLFDSQSVREIQKIVINTSPYLEFLWTPSPSGKFSSSSTYRFISSQRVSTYSSPLEPKHWKLLWKLNLNARLKPFPLENSLGHPPIQS
jgi:hypothetical protein